MNVLSIAGNLTKDPELKTTQGGKKVASFSVAINEGKDKTLFLNCVAWEKTAELIAQYCKKGDRLSCNGKLDIRSYEDSNGVKKYATEMIVREFDFPPKRDGVAASPAPQDNDESEIPF